MDLKIVSYNTLEKRTEEYIEHVDDFEKKILSIVHVVSVTNTFSRYYPYDGTYMHNDYFPYIYRNGKYAWDVPINSVTIKEFLDTFPVCITEGIFVETGFPSAGGRDYISGKEAWDVGLLLLSGAFPDAGWTIELLSKLKGIFEAFTGSEIQNKTEPHIIIAVASNYYSVFRNEEFSAREVAELFEIEEYRAEQLLKHIGYRLNPVTNKYYLLEDDRQKSWELALKLAEFEYDYAMKYDSGSSEYILDEDWT